MGKRESYTPGTFCWIDLATTDAEAAKSFYGELFGWTSEDFPAGENSVYSMMSLDDDVVCGLFYAGDEMKESGSQPSWQSYVNVEDAGAIISKVSSLGGEVVEEPFEIPGSGRSAVIRDPEGALVPLWEAHGHIGSSRVNDPGCFTWNELQTRDPEGASEFYSSLFGWENSLEKQDEAVGYVTIKNHDNANGGMMPMTEQHGDVPADWLVYFTTEDMDGSIEKVRNLGGSVVAGPMEIMPGSRIAFAHDPQGATFALFEGEVDD